ncbi:MAG: hypothetical protein IJV70_07530 [Clostridia bacterium]|nr:hypothetical protein [Clostridia bacterium]
MKYPTTDEYALSPGYLCWFRDCLPNPVRITNLHNGISAEDMEGAELTSEFHCQTFELNKEKDRIKYTVVCQRILDGWYSLIDSQKHWDKETGVMKVWMEWTQDYLEVKDVL